MTGQKNQMTHLDRDLKVKREAIMEKGVGIRQNTVEGESPGTKALRAGKRSAGSKTRPWAINSTAVMEERVKSEEWSQARTQTRERHVLLGGRCMCSSTVHTPAPLLPLLRGTLTELLSYHSLLFCKVPYTKPRCGLNERRNIACVLSTEQTEQGRHSCSLPFLYFLICCLLTDFLVEDNPFHPATPNDEVRKGPRYKLHIYHHASTNSSRTSSVLFLIKPKVPCMEEG